MAITRKDVLIPTCSFAAAGGAQPTYAYMVLGYLDLSGTPQTVTIPLTFNSTTKLWTGSWDTSAAGACNVTWFAYGTGTVQAARQGQFQIQANDLNTV